MFPSNLDSRSRGTEQHMAVSPARNVPTVAAEPLGWGKKKKHGISSKFPNPYFKQGYATEKMFCNDLLFWKRWLFKMVKKCIHMSCTPWCLEICIYENTNIHVFIWNMVRLNWPNSHIDTSLHILIIIYGNNSFNDFLTGWVVSWVSWAML